MEILRTVQNNPVMFFDKVKQCYAVRYNGETEYFNHEWESQEHNRRNAEACCKLLTNTIEKISKNNKNIR